MLLSNNLVAYTTSVLMIGWEGSEAEGGQCEGSWVGGSDEESCTGDCHNLHGDPVYVGNPDSCSGSATATETEHLRSHNRLLLQDTQGIASCGHQAVTQWLPAAGWWHMTTSLPEEIHDRLSWAQWVVAQQLNSSCDSSINYAVHDHSPLEYASIDSTCGH